MFCLRVCYFIGRVQSLRFTAFLEHGLLQSMWPLQRLKDMKFRPGFQPLIIMTCVMSQLSTGAIDPKRFTHCNQQLLTDSDISGRMANIRHQDTSFACKCIKDFLFTNDLLPRFVPLIIFTKQLTIPCSLDKQFVPSLFTYTKTQRLSFCFPFLCGTANRHGPITCFRRESKDPTSQKQAFNSPTANA